MQFKKFLTIEYVPSITDFCNCLYVLGCKLSLVRLCVSDFGITPVDDITIGITCATFCFHIAHISFAVLGTCFVCRLLFFIVIIIVVLYYYYYYCIPCTKTGISSIELLLAFSLRVFFALFPALLG